MGTRIDKFLAKYEEDGSYKRIVDRLFEESSSYLEQFAAAHGLTLLRWYNDAPLWLLKTPVKENTITRVIHVAGAPVDHRPTLAVAVSAYRDEPKYNLRLGLARGIPIGAVDPTVALAEGPPFIDALDALMLEAYGQVMAVSEKTLIRKTALTAA